MKAKKGARPMKGFSKIVFDADDDDDGGDAGVKGKAVACQLCGNLACFCTQDLSSAAPSGTSPNNKTGVVANANDSVTKARKAKRKAVNEPDEGEAEACDREQGEEKARKKARKAERKAQRRAGQQQQEEQAAREREREREQADQKATKKAAKKAARKAKQQAERNAQEAREVEEAQQKAARKAARKAERKAKRQRESDEQEMLCNRQKNAAVDDHAGNYDGAAAKQNNADKGDKSGHASRGPSVVELHSDDDWFMMLQASSEMPVLVNWSARWCGPCRKIAPQVTALCAKHPEVFFVKADVDAMDDAAAAMGVREMPTFQMFRQGKVVQSVSGADIAQLEAMIESVVSAVK